MVRSSLEKVSRDLAVKRDKTFHADVHVCMQGVYDCDSNSLCMHVYLLDVKTNIKPMI